MNMTHKEEIAALTAELNEANHRYYVLDDPTMPDFEYDQKLRRLEGAMDGIRQKYGGDAVSFARLMETGKLSESGEQEGKG